MKMHFTTISKASEGAGRRGEGAVVPWRKALAAETGMLGRIFSLLLCSKPTGPLPDLEQEVVRCLWQVAQGGLPSPSSRRF